MSPARLATLAAIPAALAAGALAFWLLGGFAPAKDSPVRVTAPGLAADQVQVCRTVVARLPAAIRDRQRRPVTGTGDRAAAYGDPPIVLTCGGPAISFPPTDQVWPLDGVCWHAEQRRDATVYTTVDRTVPVAVTFPKAYQETLQWVIEFSPAVSAVPQASRVPAGC